MLLLKTSKDTIYIKKLVCETLVNPLEGITTFRGMLIEIWDQGNVKNFKRNETFMNKKLLRHTFLT